MHNIGYGLRLCIILAMVYKSMHNIGYGLRLCIILAMV